MVKTQQPSYTEEESKQPKIDLKPAAQEADELEFKDDENLLEVPMDHFEDLDASIRQSTERSKLPPIEVLNLSRDNPSFTTVEDNKRPDEVETTEQEEIIHVPKTQEEVDDQIQGVIGDMLVEQQKLARASNKKNINQLEKRLNDILANIKMVGAQVIKEKMICVNDPSYLEQKQQLLDKMAQETG